MTSARQRKRAEPDTFRPHQVFLECERSEAGEVVPVATIFLTNRECPWRCLYCDLWKNTTTETVPIGAIPAQIDFALEQRTAMSAVGVGKSSAADMAVRDSVSQIKLYNAGSFFDPKAIPPEDFSAIAERVRGFERVIVECHPALIGESALRFRDGLSHSVLRTPHSALDQSLVTLTAPRLEVAMGLEIADDAILAKLNKHMTLAMFRRAAGYLTSHGIAVRAFVIVKPPFVRTEADALEFARRSIDFAFECGAGVVSLIPARFGPAALDELAARGDFAPPSFVTLEAALDYGVSLRRGRVFADLWDVEKLSKCPDCFPARRERLARINLHQSIEPSVTCRCQRAPGVPPGRVAVQPQVPARPDAGGTL